MNTSTVPDSPAQRRVEEILAELTGSGVEAGVQVAAWCDGELVVDAWAGTADVAEERPMGPETLVPAWSTGKGVAAALVAVLVDQGVLAYDAPVARYWPRFAAEGKERVTLGHVLAHSAGLPQLPADVTPERLLDLPAMADWIAGQQPQWEPGSAFGYHAWTYGVLLAEILRRATGRTCDQLLRDELAGPLGIGDELLFHVPEHLTSRVATCYDGGWAARLERMPPGAPFFRCVPHGVLPVAELGNRDDFRRIALPANGIMTARGAARLYAALACGGELEGVRLLSAATLKEATTGWVSGVDRMMGTTCTMGGGFVIGDSGEKSVRPAGGFGHSGSGGSTAFADPAHRFSFALVKNRMTVPGLDARLTSEIRTALGIASG
ncbi:serine hydrolase domain-containing protein [Streptomyces nodosus]|uniref:serine hydrolase domain-containing protein n=1 Tax=Streptomyces nodosus TaxID=40318 RepID=UPI000693C348|nr:serine hydrolase domain-containing protein [Streptomyces nodosus]MBB4795973.1 CubicO group peptidase (beta-lactamase class C family) [Streptomyces nodosus]